MVDLKDFVDKKLRVIEFYKGGEFGKVISFIEDNFDLDQLDVLIKKVYAFSLIRVSNVDRAKRVLEDFLADYPEDYEVLNALSYISILRGDKVAALNYLLDAEYYAPPEVKGRIKKNLSLFSEIQDIYALKSIVKPRDFLVLDLPSVPEVKNSPHFKFPRFKSVLIVLGLIFLVFVVYLGISILLGVFSKKNVVSSNIARVDIDASVKLIEPNPALTNEVVLTDGEVSSLFNELRVLLSKNRASNRARFIANYLLNSNASTQVKSRVEVLKTFMEEPEINLDWQPLYEEINSKPILYDNVYIVLRGKIVNVSKVDGVANFTFIIYGKDESVVKGFIKARMKNFFDGYIGQSITVLGRISVSKDLVLDIVKVMM
ncbi:MAG: tetratricopeptide repeat protein [Brevinematia bacterium]